MFSDFGKTMLSAAAAVVVAGTLAQPASAVTLDFVGLTDNGSTPGERAVEADPTANPLVGAPYVTIPTYAFGYAGNAVSGITGSDPFAYLDRNGAGIGVCKSITSSLQCTPSNDDNLTAGEILGLSWDSDLFLDEIFFRGEGHPNEGNFDSGDFFDISYDGGMNWILDQQLVNAKFGSYDAGGIFIPSGTEVLFAFNNEQYYISALSVSQVPLPASALLLMGALGGLGVYGRRRKAA